MEVLDEDHDMAAMKFKARVTEEGILHLNVPGITPGSDVEVEVYEKTKDDVPRDALGWPIGFLEEMSGCITDESFIRHPQPPYSKTISFDD